MSPSSTQPTNLFRITILVVAFLGWFFGGVQIGITNLAMRPAAKALMEEAGWINGFDEAAVNAMALTWFAYLQCAFLFGAAAGGYLFGKLGDKLGRARTLGISIVWFSLLTGASYVVKDPTQLVVLRFLACLGVGGCWPNGVALVSEAWANVARPVMASLIGMAGNLGIFAISTLGKEYAVTPDNWRWMLLVGASPAIIGLLCWIFVREPPGWLHMRRRKVHDEPSVFKKPYLRVTLIGIVLATVPLLGGWGSFNWIVPWADEVGPPELKAQILQMRSITSIVGSALAGVIAMLIGRRVTYFVASLAALGIAQYAFWFTSPNAEGFLLWIALWGFFNGVYFGWLPFFLPELFETRVRATGGGVSFNFGRIFTAITIFLTGYLTGLFDGNYAHIGRVTSLIFLVGMVVVLLAPDTSNRDMND